MSRIFTKPYSDTTGCRVAAANHRWLSALGLRLPELVAERSRELDFHFISGRHVTPDDLIPVARFLGQSHAAAYEAELHRARLDHVYLTRSGHRIRDFRAPRLHAIENRLRSGVVPDPLLNVTNVRRLLDRAADEPVAFYKDTNPRNILITTDGPVMVDFDDLTLAPFGYDLAKLIVTLVMTYGVLPQAREALTAYNATTEPIPAVSWDQLMAWAEVHHLLTSPYLGRGGYLHGWHELRLERRLVIVTDGAVKVSLR